MIITLNPNSTADYVKFIAIKSLPSYRFVGRTAYIPDEYAHLIDDAPAQNRVINWEPSDFLFDYQRDITKLAIKKRKFAVFADCGLGKTLIILEFVQAALQALHRQNRGVLIVSPLMVVGQTLDEAARFYPGLDIEPVRAAGLSSWLKDCGGKIGITNYEAIKDDCDASRLGGLILDESSMLKSHYGQWGTRLISMGAGLEWKLCSTGTPAPNDRIEYANHAVFLDAFNSVNGFLATFFVNRGQTSERWALKPHALAPFYRALSHWCIFLTRPEVYGWRDNCDTIPPIKVNIHQVPMTEQQRHLASLKTGQIFATDIGGIATRSALGQIAKGHYKGERIDTNKPAFIKSLVDQWPDESTIIWCIYNEEQNIIREQFPDAANITGDTPFDERNRLIDDFKAGRCRVMITKPKILGFGLNLQIATRQVFSGLQDSYESFYQAVKRSNRYGATEPLNVHIPVTDIEEPMVQNVLRKSRMVQQDTEEQERIFKEYGYAHFG